MNLQLHELEKTRKKLVGNPAGRVMLPNVLRLVSILMLIVRTPLLPAVVTALRTRQLWVNDADTRPLSWLLTYPIGPLAMTEFRTDSIQLGQMLIPPLKLLLMLGETIWTPRLGRLVITVHMAWRVRGVRSAAHSANRLAIPLTRVIELYALTGVGRMCGHTTLRLMIM